MSIRNLLLLFLALCAISLSACSQEPDEPRHYPGSFLRPGGDAVTGPEQSR